MNVYRHIKKLLDIVLSIILLIVLLPLFVVIAIIVKVTSKGPVFFAHKRIGQNGREFNLYKFRTMVPDAEELINKFTSEQMKEFKNQYKLKNDPRVTKIGKVLRATSLDELPQLVNVLKGDLSLIGPRPIIKEELEKYKNNKNKFLSIKPGLTGYWVAYNTPDTTYEERIQMELHYVDNVSLVLDLKIFFKTIITVISRIIKTGD